MKIRRELCERFLTCVVNEKVFAFFKLGTVPKNVQNHLKAHEILLSVCNLFLFLGTGPYTVILTLGFINKYLYSICTKSTSYTFANGFGKNTFTKYFLPKIHFA